ncbi:methyl-accepting chemotaxis protein [Rhizobium bangladeshense]|uniref:methyl-accepting chemotaxis protein n=1 Tax=Rhizobium bangladeshense TaxID=1138189 RepID=UPI0007E56622|nr:HAMP domain-containing methyl-accepting chemotaxis protein [Rhizobium bangladeshense]
MLIDKILSQFKIKTKVLMFVLPFVVSISAVGLTGLYASGLLQDRMEISNSVLQSLTGFKDLYSSMDEFLRITTEPARDKLYADIKSQESVLAAMSNQVGSDSPGYDELADATSKTGGVSIVVDRLWASHKNALILRRSIERAQDVLTDKRLETVSLAKALARDIARQQFELIATLRAVDRLAKDSDFLLQISDELASAPTPADKFAVVKEKQPTIARLQQDLDVALPEDQQTGTKSLAGVKAGLVELTRLLELGSATEINSHQASQLMFSLRQLSKTTRQLASELTNNAAVVSAEVENRIPQVDSAIETTRRLETSMYSLQLALSKFVADVSKENFLRMRQEITRVAANSSDFNDSISGVNLKKDADNSIPTILSSLDENGLKLLDTTLQRTSDYIIARAQLNQIWDLLTAFAQTQKQTAGEERQQANSISVLTTAIGIGLSVIGGIALVLTLQRPIGQITAAMRRIAEGRLETTISGEQRPDEIGDIARALGIFKENAIAKIRIEELSEEERTAAELERQSHDAEKRETDRHIELAVNELAAGLERMSRGDISTTIDTPFIGRLEQLREDFNSSMLRLQATMRQIRDNVEMIHSNGSQMAQSAADLAKRTEQQAASLEETAAAVDQITVTVRSSAERANDADQIVRQAKRSADDSATVVGKAIDAMRRIEDASRQIEQIIGVIDEIAFQTNLLALNAGIEAARAGEAGNGFAVVAMEVRELAQRSAAAAQEIKSLINRSTIEVGSGSQSVQETGTVLARISAQIVTISQHVEMIARASHDQSNALLEVNSTINQIDQMTQQNAAMVEETTASSIELAAEADTLTTLISQFQLDRERKSAVNQAA